MKKLLKLCLMALATMVLMACAQNLESEAENISDNLVVKAELERDGVPISELVGATFNVSVGDKSFTKQIDGNETELTIDIGKYLIGEEISIIGTIETGTEVFYKGKLNQYKVDSRKVNVIVPFTKKNENIYNVTFNGLKSIQKPSMGKLNLVNSDNTIIWSGNIPNEDTFKIKLYLDKKNDQQNIKAVVKVNDLLLGESIAKSLTTEVSYDLISYSRYVLWSRLDLLDGKYAIYNKLEIDGQETLSDNAKNVTPKNFAFDYNGNLWLIEKKTYKVLKYPCNSNDPVEVTMQESGFYTAINAYYNKEKETNVILFGIGGKLYYQTENGKEKGIILELKTGEVITSIECYKNDVYIGVGVEGKKHLNNCNPYYGKILKIENVETAIKSKSLVKPIDFFSVVVPENEMKENYTKLISDMQIIGDTLYALIYECDEKLISTGGFLLEKKLNDGKLSNNILYETTAKDNEKITLLEDNKLYGPIKFIARKQDELVIADSTVVGEKTGQDRINRSVSIKLEDNIIFSQVKFNEILFNGVIDSGYNAY